MSTPTVKDLEIVIGWLEQHASKDKTNTLHDFLATAKGDLSNARSLEERELAFAKVVYETSPSTTRYPWDISGLTTKWENLSEGDRKIHARRAAPLATALEKAGWKKPAPKPRKWDRIEDVPTNVIVVDSEGDRWENRNDKWGLGVGRYWAATEVGRYTNYGPYREHFA